MWARDEERVDFLLESGAKADMLSKNAENALFFAKDPKVIEKLVKAGCDPNHISKDGSSPIFYNLWGGSRYTVGAIEALLKCGANPDLQYGDKVGYTPLYFAIQLYTEEKDNLAEKTRVEIMPEIIRLLAKYGADPDLKTTPKGGVEVSPRSLAKNFPEVLAWLNTPRLKPNTSIQIATGEIALTGVVIKIDKDAGQIVIAAGKYTLPTGKVGAINPKKEKLIVVTPQTMIHAAGDSKALTLADLVVGGKSLQIVGTDAGAGKALPAREIIVTP